MNSEIELAAKEMRALNQIFIVQSKLDEIQKFIDDTIGGEKTIPLQDFERKNAELNVFWNSIVEENEKCGNLVSEFNEFLIKNYRSAEKIEQLSRISRFLNNANKNDVVILVINASYIHPEDDTFNILSETLERLIK